MDRALAPARGRMASLGPPVAGDCYPRREWRPGHGKGGHVHLVPHVVQYEQVLVLGEQAVQPRPSLRHVGDRPTVPQDGSEAGLQLQRRVRA